MTDAEIKQSLQQILNRLHDSKSGIFQHNSNFKNGTIKLKHALSRGIQTKDVPFNVSGNDILEQKLGDIISCTGMTKAFLAAGKDSGLDMRAVITVNKDALDKGITNDDHVVPAVKMSDGNYHIIEPRARYIDGADSAKLFSTPIEIGKDVFHILPSMKGQPYEVVAIITPDELEKIKSLNDIKRRNHRPEFFAQIYNQRNGFENS